MIRSVRRIASSPMLRLFRRRHSAITGKATMPSNLPNLRRLFVDARSEAEESAYSRKAFYNLAIFVSSVAIFSLVAQRMASAKSIAS